MPENETGGTMAKPGEITITKNGKVLEKRPPADIIGPGGGIIGETSYRPHGEDPRGAEMPKIDITKPPKASK